MARREKTAQLEEISILSLVCDTTVEMFTFILKEKFRFYLFFPQSYGRIHYCGIGL